MHENRYNISAGYSLAEEARQLVKGVRQIPYIEDFLDADRDDFRRSVYAPQQHTILHIFLENWESFLWNEGFDVGVLDEDFATIKSYLEVCGGNLPTWFREGNLQANATHLRDLIAKAVPVSAQAAFQLLFQDKEFLLAFQDLIKKARTQSDDAKRVDRPNYIPSWLRNAVYFRDRGQCQHCGKDVSGLLNLENKIHLDHLLPLNAGGTNDATNFQILCDDCNLKKGDARVSVVNRNPLWWEKS